MGCVRRRATESNNVPREVTGTREHELAIVCAGLTIVKDDIDARLLLKGQRTASDHRGAVSCHWIVDLQRASVRRLEDTIIDDCVTGIDGENSTRQIGNNGPLG